MCALVNAGTKLPDGVGNMKSLEELKTPDVLSQSTSVLQELGQLAKLRRLHIVGYPKEGNHVEKMIILCILGACNLQYLSMQFKTELAGELSLDLWSPAPCSLRKFHMKEGTGPICKVPNGLAQLSTSKVYFLRSRKLSVKIYT